VEPFVVRRGCSGDGALGGNRREIFLAEVHEKGCRQIVYLRESGSGIGARRFPGSPPSRDEARQDGCHAREITLPVRRTSIVGCRLQFPGWHGLGGLGDVKAGDHGRRQESVT